MQDHHIYLTPRFKSACCYLLHCPALLRTTHASGLGLYYSLHLAVQLHLSVCEYLGLVPFNPSLSLLEKDPNAWAPYTMYFGLLPLLSGPIFSINERQLIKIKTEKGKLALPFHEPPRYRVCPTISSLRPPTLDHSRCKATLRSESR